MHPTGCAVPSGGTGHGPDIGRFVHLRRRTGATGIVPVSKGLIALRLMVRPPGYGLRPCGFIRIDHVEIAIQDRHSIGEPTG